MRLSPAAKNVMLDALDESAVAGAKYTSLHSAYSISGANEMTGGTPPYARKAAAWGPASGGIKATTAAIVFDVAGGSTVRFVGFWDALTVGNFLGMTPNGGGVPQAFVVPDISADVVECAGHGFVAGDVVVAWAVPGDPLPSGLIEGTVYFVLSVDVVGSPGTPSPDRLRLSATTGGTAINLLGIGAGTLQKLVAEVFGAQGTHTLTSVSLTLD